MLKSKTIFFKNPDIIVDIFDRLYTKKNNNKNKFLIKVRFYSFQRFLTRLVANIIIAVYFRATRNKQDAKLSNITINSPKLIVSLTTFPLRAKRVWIVIESILRQTQKPDIIVLWISKEQFSSRKKLPKKLLQLEKRGLSIRFCDENIKSHKKYFYAIKEFPNDTLITIDDDIIYPTFLVEKLFKLHKKYPKSICCHRAILMTFRGGNQLPYDQWTTINKLTQPSLNIFQTSGGGTLFPANSLHQDATNKEIFMKYCPDADDIWLNCMSRLNGTTIVKSDYFSYCLPIIYLRNKKLYLTNVSLGKNDEQLNNIINYYREHLNQDIFKD